MIEDKLIEYNENEDYFRYESGFYWEDWDACSVVFVTEKMIVRYGLERESTEEWFKYARDSSDYQDKDDEFFFEMKSKYAQILYLDHICAYSKTKVGCRTVDTPHGNVKSPGFVAWFNFIPCELFKECEDDVFVERWCE